MKYFKKNRGRHAHLMEVGKPSILRWDNGRSAPYHQESEFSHSPVTPNMQSELKSRIKFVRKHFLSHFHFMRTIKHTMLERCLASEKTRVKKKRCCFKAVG